MNATDRLAMSALGTTTVVLAALLAGCSKNEGMSLLPDQWNENGPATTADYDTPTASVVFATRAPAPSRSRPWNGMHAHPDLTPATHWPLYFEDPFEDKGAGREGRNKYHTGWEDVVATPYGLARFLLNTAAFPVSTAVTPPWTVMESDGRVSKQLLGPDHDAVPEGEEDWGAQPVSAGAADVPQAPAASPGSAATPAPNPAATPNAGASPARAPGTDGVMQPVKP